MLVQSRDIITDEEFRTISDVVYEHCGINLHEGKRELVQARLAKLLRTRPFESATAYIEHVLADPSGDDFGGLIDALSTNLTSFYRESNHFDFLKDKLLPAVLERRRAKGSNRLRGWSAGCASGEEPYTLAMTVLDALNGRDEWDLKILATDISRRVLRIARGGSYGRSRLAPLPPTYKGRYFSPGEGGAFDVVPAVKDCIRFNHLNLLGNWPFKGKFDFVFCRNVMIYFDKPTQERLVSRFYDCLESGGMLFTGHSESLTGVSHRFRYVQPTIYAKH